MYADQVTDLVVEMIKAHLEKDETRKAELDKKLAQETIPKVFGILDAKISQSGSGFFVSSGLTWADLYMFNILEWLGEKKDQTLAFFPNLKTLDQKVRETPRVTEWLLKRPKTDL